MPKRATLLSLLLLATALADAYAGEIFRWTDASGRVHYGDSVPDQYRSNARRLAAKESGQDKAPRAMSAGSSDERPVDPAAGVRAAGESSPGAGETDCERAQREYRESQDCFAPYVTASGAVKAEAFRHCKEVKQPPLCR